MADEELGGTATLEAPPVAAPETATPAPAAPAEPRQIDSVNPEAKAETVTIAGEKVTIAGARQRDASGKFVKKDGTTESPAGGTATTTAVPAAPVLDQAILDRAYKAGLTPYDAQRYGDKLEGELVRREAAAARPAAPVAPAAPPVAQPKQPAAPTGQPSKLDALIEQLAKAPELDPSMHDEATILRDKVTREALQLLREENRQLQSTLQTEVGGLQESLQQERKRLQAEAEHARDVEYDKFFATLGPEFLPALGKGDQAAVANTPYFAKRGGIVELAELGEQIHPNLTRAERAKLALGFFFPDIHQQNVQREAYEAAKEAAKQRGFSGVAATPGPNSTHSGPAWQDPKIQAQVAEFDRINALEGRS